jgi:hypothetical protein
MGVCKTITLLPEECSKFRGSSAIDACEIYPEAASEQLSNRGLNQKAEASIYLIRYEFA